MMFAADVAVHVDEPRQNVVSLQVHFTSAWRQFRSLRLLLDAARRTHGHHLDDAIALDYDVCGTERRRSGPIDHSNVAQDQLRPRTLAFVAVRRRQNLRCVSG
jgi:hypothetical protein